MSKGAVEARRRARQEARREERAEARRARYVTEDPLVRAAIDADFAAEAEHCQVVKCDDCGTEQTTRPYGDRSAEFVSPCVICGGTAATFVRMASA